MVLCLLAGRRAIPMSEHLEENTGFIYLSVGVTWILFKTVLVFSSVTSIFIDMTLIQALFWELRLQQRTDLNCEYFTSKYLKIMLNCVNLKLCDSLRLLKTKI